METIERFFSVKWVLFSALGYELSYLEFVGTIFNLASVWFATRNSVWTWPIGNIAVVLFAVLFYQIQLYSDLVEQVYFLVTGFYGWWVWSKFREGNAGPAISRNPRSANIAWLFVIALGTLGMGSLMSRMPMWLPRYFPEPASFPYLDAFTTVMSFVANFLMARRKLECWMLWILVDIIGIGLYFGKGVVFVSILYAIFLVLATRGLYQWKTTYTSAEAGA